MMLEEANARLKKVQITEEQLETLNIAYIVMDFDKDTFCKLVDATGVDIWLERKEHFDWLLRASDCLNSKSRYVAAKRRLEELEIEREHLGALIDNYDPFALV